MHTYMFSLHSDDLSDIAYCGSDAHNDLFLHLHMDPSLYPALPPLEEVNNLYNVSMSTVS